MSAIMSRIASYVAMLAISIAAVCLSFPYLYIPWIILSVAGIVFMRDGEQDAASFWGVIYFIIYSVLYFVVLMLVSYSESILSISSALCDLSVVKPSACEEHASLALYSFTWSALFMCVFPMAPLSMSLMIAGACHGTKAKLSYIAVALLSFFFSV